MLLLGTSSALVSSFDEESEFKRGYKSFMTAKNAGSHFIGENCVNVLTVT